MKKVLALSVSVLLFGTLVANAGTITLTGSFPTTTTWQITASNTGDGVDNNGIYGAGFSLKFGTASPTGNTVLFKGPTATFFDGSDPGNGTAGPYGFTTKLGGSPVTDTLSHAFATAQGLADPAGDYYYHVGTTGGNAASNTMPGDPSQGFTHVNTASTYLAPVVLFSGNRLVGEQVLFDTTIPASGSLFIADGGGAGTNLQQLAGNQITEVQFPTVSVPEPASLVLMGLAGLGLVVVGRRRSK